MSHKAKLNSATAQAAVYDEITLDSGLVSRTSLPGCQASELVQGGAVRDQGLGSSPFTCGMLCVACDGAACPAIAFPPACMM